jgi:AP-3 complex subunit delta
VCVCVCVCVLLQFGVLTPLEPRLAKKLVDPLTNLIQTTPAMSLLYEAISTVTLGELAHPPLVKLAVQKLRSFIESPDQNRACQQAITVPPSNTHTHACTLWGRLLLLILAWIPACVCVCMWWWWGEGAAVKYLGLLALARFLEEYPKLVAEHNDVILACIDDNDVSIRMRALDLLVGMVRTVVPMAHLCTQTHGTGNERIPWMQQHGRRDRLLCRHTAPRPHLCTPSRKRNVARAIR